MLAKRKGKTKISIDYSKCSTRAGVDPRECTKCLKVCPNWVMILQPSFDVEQDLVDPTDWRIDVLWPSMCTRCMDCVDTCPHDAIQISW